MRRYISTHWQGHQTLSRALVLNTITLNLLLIVAIQHSTDWLKDNLTTTDFTLLLWLIPLWTLVLAWQTVGVFRSASQRIKNYGSAANFYAALAVMLTSIALALSNIANQMGNDIDYLQRGVDEYKPAMPTFSLEHINANTLLLRGDIGFGATRQLRALINEYPAVNELLLESEGGVIVEARGLANLVKENQLNTTVTTRCFSACTIVFIAGDKRTLQQSAKLGFHQYKVDSISQLPWINPDEEQSKDLAFFEEKDVAEWFLKKMYDTPHNEIWTPSIDTLVRAGVITQYSVL